MRFPLKHNFHFFVVPSYPVCPAVSFFIVYLLSFVLVKFPDFLFLDVLPFLSLNCPKSTLSLEPLSFDYGRFLMNLAKERKMIYTHCTSKNKVIRLIEIRLRIRSAKNIIPARLKKVMNRLNLSQKYFL